MSIKRLQDDNLTLRTINQSTVIMTESLSITDDGFHERILFLDPAGFTRTIVPLGTFRAGYTVVIFNQASSNNIIFDPNSLAYIIRQSSVYGPGSFTYNGSSWECRSPSRVFLSEFSGDLDDIDDGATYGRILLTSISAGKIILAECTGDLDSIADGSSYGRVSSTEISAGMIKLSSHSITEFSDTGALALESSLGVLNFISNGDFTIWNDAYTVPDGWGVTGTAARTTVQKKFGYCSVIVTNAAGAMGQVYQYFYSNYGINYFYGKTISLAVWVWASDANRVRVAIGHDGYGGGGFYSGYHSGNSSWEQLTVIGHTVPSDATVLWASCIIDSGTSISAYFDGAMCVDGNVIPSNWIPRGVASPIGVGAVITASYFALLGANGVTRFMVNNTGSLALQTSSSAYGFYYFGAAGTINGQLYGEGDLRIGSVTDYIWWDQSAGKFLINTSGSMTIKSAGAFNVQAGGGMVISGYGDYSTYCPIVFSGTAHYITLQLNTAGDAIYLKPSANAHQLFYIGVPNVNYFDWIIAYAATSVYLYAVNARININAGGYIETQGNIIPDINYEQDDIGTSAYHFDYIYSSHALVVGDLMVMDEKDDLAALMNIKTKTDAKGLPIMDELRQFPLVDDATLPEYILGIHNKSRDEVQIEMPVLGEAHHRSLARTIPAQTRGDTTRKEDGRPFFDTTSTISWLMGCIKQLNIKVDTLIKEIKDKEAEAIKP